MSETNTDSDADDGGWTSISVRPGTRRRLRIRKAEEDVTSYDDLINSEMFDNYD